MPAEEGEKILLTATDKLFVQTPSVSGIGEDPRILKRSKDGPFMQACIESPTPAYGKLLTDILNIDVSLGQAVGPGTI